MSLDRTEQEIRLLSNDGLYYSVSIGRAGTNYVPEPDETTGAFGTSDAYVALVGDDDQVYRWTLKTESSGLVRSELTLSPDQDEPAVDYIDIQRGGTWYRVTVELEEDADGEDIPTFAVGNDGEPYVPDVPTEEEEEAVSVPVRLAAPRLNTLKMDLEVGIVSSLNLDSEKAL